MRADQQQPYFPQDDEENKKEKQNEPIPEKSDKKMAAAKTMWRHLPSKIGRQPSTSLWVEFVTMAADYKACNLGQGFTNAPAPAFVTKHLAEVAAHPERTDWHQYTRAYGHKRFVDVLGKLYSRLLGVQLDSANEILVTVGAYMSLYYAFLGWINPGEEVIIFEPAYDSYVTQIQMAGGVPVPIVLELDTGAKTSAGYRLDLAELRAKVSPKTKMIVLNNPNNPTGKLFSREELEGIAKIATENDLLVISDEVYEFMVYPGREMIRFASLPGMFERTITIGSAGKAFSATGWKTGWSIAPKRLLEPMYRVHENCIFTASTPIQEALARAFEEELALLETNPTESYLQSRLAAELLQKRDVLAKYLESAGFRPILPDAGYFMMADYTHLQGPFRDEPRKGDEGEDYNFVRWLCKEKKLAAIPPSAFYSPQHRPGRDHYIRLCFFKKDETIEEAIKILKNLKN